MKTYFKTKRQKIKSSRADYWFSRYIRIRDSYESGYGRCCTCGKAIFWLHADCGHYVTRDRTNTRFNEQNAHLQCKFCNGVKKGEQGKHGIFIDKKYGQGTAEKLMNLGDIRGSKLSKFDEGLISKEYQKKAKEIAKKKGIELK
jgi:hypothetical protein